MSALVEKQTQPYVIISKVSTPDGDDVVVSVESHANNEQHARMISVLEVRELVPEHKKIKIVAASEIDADGVLVDNAVLDYKPKIAVTLNDVPTIKPNPEGNRTPRKENKPKKAAALPAPKGKLISPITPEFFKAVAEGKVCEYDIHNRPKTGGN